MADNEQKKTPWGDALAPFEKDGKTTWLDLGPVWKGENGSLQFTLHVEPFHWRAHAAERRIVIRQREERQQPQQQQPPQKNGGRK